MKGTVNGYEVHRPGHCEGSPRGFSMLVSEGAEHQKAGLSLQRSPVRGGHQGKQLQPEVVRAVLTVCTAVWRKLIVCKVREGFRETLDLAREG